MKELIVVAISVSPFIAALVVVSLLDFRDVHKARKRERHAATLRNIARLERELGIRR